MSNYPIDELEFKNGSESEQKRTRKIFIDLKQRAIEQKILLEREKEFLCMGLKLSQIESDGSPEDYSFCDTFIFRELYLTYYTNNLKGPFYKPVREEIVEVSESEKLKDFKTLNRFADEWMKIVETTNHQDIILQEISSETRKDLKELEKKYSKLLRNFKSKAKEYKYQKRKIILHSKFIYLLTKRIMEDYEKSNFEIPFDGNIIEFTPYSLIHIVNRHYAEKIKENNEKTYHYGKFFPKQLHLDIKNILTEIDKLNIFRIESMDRNMIFTFENTYYQLWFEKKTKQVKGKGNVEYYRIQTFYPIYDIKEIANIEKMYNRHIINENLSVFSKK